MPRIARIRSESGIYHVMARGVNRQNIFRDVDDAHFYLRLLRRLSSETDCILYGFCLMDNHVHLLCREQGDGNLSKLMHRLGTIFALWHNGKYQRVGHLFQGRYASEAVEDDRYLLVALRYIHQNPVKAFLSQTCADYPYSSYNAYSLGYDPFRLVDVNLATSLFCSKRHLLEFFNTPNEDTLQIRSDNYQATDAELEQYLQSLLAGGSTMGLRQLHKSERNLMLRRLKETKVYSLGQIARVTGVSKSTVARA